MKNKSVAIIGGGLGGLFTGAILAKEGFSVTILEKNSTIGGGLQSFKRFGESFDTGMHVIGGLQEGGNIRKLCQYLGIFQDIEIKDVDNLCSNKLYFEEDHSTYTIPSGKDAFIKYLSSLFPEESENLNRYVNEIYDITNSIDLFNLRPSSSYINIYPEHFTISADSFIAQYVKNKKLRSVLAYMNPLYGGRGNETPAYVHAIINVLYINGTSRFVGGSYKFANLLANLIIENGGQIKVNEKVEWIEVNNRQVEFIRTIKGNIYSADYYISDIHPCSLLNILPNDAFPKSYRNRLNEIPNSYSAFSLYIKLKKNSFEYLNHSEFYMGKYENIWKFGNADDDVWPKGFLLMTPPSAQQEKYAKTALVTAPMPFEYVRKWESTHVGNRGEDYEQWKLLRVHDILDIIEKMHPGFNSCVEDINSSSPLTIRDFYGVKEGALSGFSKDWKNLALSQVPVITKISNLFLTGQNNNLHGFCGVPLTSINTCEAILGKNYIINKINECVSD